MLCKINRVLSRKTGGKAGIDDIAIESGAVCGPWLSGIPDTQTQSGQKNGHVAKPWQGVVVPRISPMGLRVHAAQTDGPEIEGVYTRTEIRWFRMLV